MTQKPGEKKKGLQELSAWEYLSGAPLLFGGVALTFASLGYGLYQMMRGDMSKQAKGMTGRIGFQMATIFLIATTVGWKADKRQQEALDAEEARDKRRAHDKEEKRLKQEEAKTAADLKAAEAPKVEAPKVEKVEAKVEIPAAAPQEKKEKL